MAQRKGQRVAAEPTQADLPIPCRTPSASPTSCTGPLPWCGRGPRPAPPTRAPPMGRPHCRPPGIAHPAHLASTASLWTGEHLPSATTRSCLSWAAGLLWSQFKAGASSRESLPLPLQETCSPWLGFPLPAAWFPHGHLNGQGGVGIRDRGDGDWAPLSSWSEESGGGVVVGAQVGRVLQGTGQAADAQNGERP